MNRVPSSSSTIDRHAEQREAVIPALLNAARVLERSIDDGLAAVGLSTSKLAVLTQLTEAGGPLPLSRIAERVSCVRSNMTQLIDRLEADGLVRRVDDPADRRSVLAAVTRLGEDRQRAGARELTRIRRQCAAALTVPQCETLDAMLDAVCAAAEGRRPTA